MGVNKSGKTKSLKLVKSESFENNADPVLLGMPLLKDG
jgi:hypothetical protein